MSVLLKLCKCIGLEGYKTIRHPIDAVYGDRYKYDLMIRSINQDIINRINSEVDGIVISEPETFFTCELLGKDVKLNLKMMFLSL